MHWLLSGLLVGWCSEPEDAGRTKCVGTAREVTEAVAACEWLIARHANYDYKWTAFLNWFPVRRREGERIVLTGNEVKFQNGFRLWRVAVNVLSLRLQHAHGKAFACLPSLACTRSELELAQ